MLALRLRVRRRVRRRVRARVRARVSHVLTFRLVRVGLKGGWGSG